MPADETAAAPFTDGRWLLSHNGRGRPGRAPAAPEAESVCDSALLAAHVFALGPRARSARSSPTWRRRDPAARLNLLLTDGERILATTLGRHAQRTCATDDGVVVASEPYDDDPRWVDVPDHHLLEATRRRGRP